MAERRCISTKLVYNSSISVGEAIGYAYKLGCKEKVGDFFLQFQRDIQETFRQADPLPWLPTPNYLEATALDATLPNQLVKFFSS